MSSVSIFVDTLPGLSYTAALNCFGISTILSVDVYCSPMSDEYQYSPCRAKVLRTTTNASVSQCDGGIEDDDVQSAGKSVFSGGTVNMIQPQGNFSRSGTSRMHHDRMYDFTVLAILAILIAEACLEILARIS